MSGKPDAPRKPSHTEIGRRLRREPRFRAVCAASAGLAVNLLYALYHGALGVVNRSLWFVAMFAYYVILSAMRLSAVLCEWRCSSPAFREIESFVAKLCGVLLILLSFLLSGVVCISLFQNVAVKRHEIVMITIATYTFYKITAAVIRAVKQRRNPDPLLAVLRTIGYAEAAGVLLTLQRSMLISFGPMDEGDIVLMNALTGIAVCLFILLLGIFTILKSSRRRRKPYGTV